MARSSRDRPFIGLFDARPLAPGVVEAATEGPVGGRAPQRPTGPLGVEGVEATHPLPRAITERQQGVTRGVPLAKTSGRVGTKGGRRARGGTRQPRVREVGTRARASPKSCDTSRRSEASQCRGRGGEPLPRARKQTKRGAVRRVTGGAAPVSDAPQQVAGAQLVVHRRVVVTVKMRRVGVVLDVA